VLRVAPSVLGDPVEAGQPGVEHAVADVARHLLRADQHALDLGIVDRREVRARADVDVEAGAREQLNRRVLQRALRDAELRASWNRDPSARWKKQVRSPVWQTLPSPSRSALTSSVSSSQSIEDVADGERLPDVSPFVHSVLRVRLKKVT
jgi:hypothetical protein